MHHDNLQSWQHAHTFNQDRKRPGEPRTIIVISLTGVMMLVEVAAGVIFGSMALLADGLHMASHAVALGISAFAYVYARRHARDDRYSFGTGKVNALGGFASAILLAVFAALMAWESARRLVSPVQIVFIPAFFVAVLGLLVNAASVLILNFRHDDQHHDDHHGHDQAHHEDHNLRAAYLHVLADAFTSILAIFALLAAKYSGFIWIDPLMGILGAILVARWSLGLVRATGVVLLDRQAPEAVRQAITAGIERVDGNRVADLHVWSIGPNLYGLILTVVTRHPQPPEHYKQLLPAGMGLAHVSIEVYPCPDPEERPSH